MSQASTWGAACLALAIASGLSACPLPGTQRATPPPFGGFPPDSRLTGRFLFKGFAPPQPAEARYRAPRGVTAATRARDHGLGYFSFPATPTGSFQLVWDDGGDLYDAGVNTIGYYASDQATPLPPAPAPEDLAAPQRQLDLYWAVEPRPAPGETIGEAFAFRPVPCATPDGSDAHCMHPPPEYFVSVFDDKRNPVADTATAAAGPDPESAVRIPWDRRDKTASASVLPAGRYLFKVRFQSPRVSAGTVKRWGDEWYFGASKFVEFRLP